MQRGRAEPAVQRRVGVDLPERVDPGPKRLGPLPDPFHEGRTEPDEQRVERGLERCPEPRGLGGKVPEEGALRNPGPTRHGRGANTGQPLLRQQGDRGFDDLLSRQARASLSGCLHLRHESSKKKSGHSLFIQASAEWQPEAVRQGVG